MYGYRQQIKNAQQVIWDMIGTYHNEQQSDFTQKYQAAIYFNQTPSQEGAWRSGGKISRIPNLTTRARLVVS
jgi:hypothetical protein